MSSTSRATLPSIVGRRQRACGLQDGVAEGADLVRHHDRLQAVTADGDDPHAATHYFDDDPTVRVRRPSTIDVCAARHRVARSTTDRGVFGHGRVDAGTKLLLLKAPPPAAAGDLLDLGCGAGADRADHGPPVAGGDGVGGRRQRAGPIAVRAATPSATGSPTSGCAPRRRPRRRCASTTHLEQPADPHRQAGAARDAAALARPARPPTATAALVVQKHLGSRLAAALADRAGPPHRARRLRRRLPRPRRLARASSAMSDGPAPDRSLIASHEPPAR